MLPGSCTGGFREQTAPTQRVPTDGSPGDFGRFNLNLEAGVLLAGPPQSCIPPCGHFAGSRGALPALPAGAGDAGHRPASKSFPMVLLKRCEFPGSSLICP